MGSKQCLFCEHAPALHPPDSPELRFAGSYNIKPITVKGKIVPIFPVFLSSIFKVGPRPSPTPTNLTPRGTDRWPFLIQIMSLLVQNHVFLWSPFSLI